MNHYRERKLLEALTPLVKELEHKQPDMWEFTMQPHQHVELTLSVEELRALLLAAGAIPGFQDLARKHKVGLVWKAGAEA